KMASRMFIPSFSIRMIRSTRTMAFVTTIPINISNPINTVTEIVSPTINNPTNEPITVNGNENNTANGAVPSPNVTTRMKYTIKIAASIAIINWLNVSSMSAATPPISYVTPLGTSILSITLSVSEVTFVMSSVVIVPLTVP